MSDRTIIEQVSWTLELNIECPKCENSFDYLETDEYRNHDGWEGMKHCESDSQANIEVSCPECGIDLLVKETIY